jgi:hypothetical protein
MLNANIVVIEFVAFGAAVGPGPYKPIEGPRSIVGVNWPQSGEDAGGVE